MNKIEEIQNEINKYNKDLERIEKEKSTMEQLINNLNTYLEEEVENYNKKVIKELLKKLEENKQNAI